MRIDGPKITGSFSLGNTVFPDLNSLATTTSINSLSSSVATTGSNLYKGTQTHSGSILPAVNNTYDLGSPTQQFRHVYISTGSLYIDGTKVLGSTSSELQITTDVGQSFKVLETGADTITLQSADGNVTLTSTGGGDVVIDPNTGVIGLKGTVTIYTGNKIVSSDGNAIQFGNGISITGSIVATGTSLVSGSSQVLNGSGVWSGSAQLPNGIVSGSSQVLNNSGIWSGSAQLPNGIVSSSVQVTGYGFSTTGSNNFIGTQTITGSLYISQNLVVQGSSSLQDVTGSNVYIGTNKINLNTATPSIRFGGVSVFDSGSNFGESGSLLWDSTNNRWLYQHPASSGAPYKSAIIISGPQNSGSLGSENTLNSGKISKAVGDDHIGDSIMTETGGGIGISGSLSITGSIVASGTSLWSGSGQLPSGVVSGSNQIVSLLPSGVISGSAQLPSGTVSGSAQVDVLSTTNIARIATTGSNSFNGTQTFGYGRLVSTGYNSSAQITINASYDGGQTNTYTPDYAGDSTAGMFVMKQSNGGYGDFNFYGKNHQTTGGSHNISTFNVIMGMNTNGRVAIGKLTANTPLDVNGNTLITGSLTTTSTVTINGVSDGAGTLYVTASANTNAARLRNNDPSYGTLDVLNSNTSGYGIYAVAAKHYISGSIGLNTTTNTLYGLSIKRTAGSNGALNLIGNDTIVGNPGVNFYNDNTTSSSYISMYTNGGLNINGVMSVTGSAVGINTSATNLQTNGVGLNISSNTNQFPVLRLERVTGGGGSKTLTNWEWVIGSSGQLVLQHATDTYEPLTVEYNTPSNTVYLKANSNVGINDSNPSKKLTVNFGTSISDGLLVTGSQRQETRFKSSGEHSNVFIDSGHSNIYLPTLGLQRSSTSYGEIKLQRASNSDSIGSFTESEMVIGSTTTVPVSIKTNEVRRVVIASGGDVSVYNGLTVSNNITARNFNKYVRSWASNGSYIWYEQLDAISGYFDSAGWYKGFIRESNGAHYHGYYFDILVGTKGYGGLSSQYRVLNLVQADSPYTGGCGGTSFAAIDNSGFTKQSSACYDNLELYITRIG
jgi:hypothetical protein